MTTSAEIQGWFERGKREKATHMIVVCDTFDHDDYPVYVQRGEDVRERVAHYGTNMQRVMEVYSYAIPWEQQSGARVWNLD